LAGEINIQGEAVMKLDRLADLIIQNMNDHTGRVAVMASEENPNIITIAKKYRIGKYVLLFDPLDGSSNIDYNVSTGTIFAIYHRKTEKGPGTLEDCLQPGRDLVASVYILYGSSTMLVYTTGQGVHGFTLEPTIGEFLLSHPNIRIPDQARYYSVNQSYEASWSEEIRQYTQYLQGLDGVPKGLSMRYIGSLISDFHRNLLSGGIFYYPANRETPKGKLRLLYEAVPLAFIAEQAGGYASDGRQNILSIHPTHLHQRTPLFIGNRDLVEAAEAFIRKHGH
jgi:fructose-1,6-bisphosphatase I